MHIMVDLETIGTRPGSAICSLGAVAFDPVAGTMGQEFYAPISLRSCQAARLTFDADTVGWWLEQSEAARAALKGGEDVQKVLQEFQQWWRALRAKFIWAHGANFDEPLLSAAFRACGLAVPWKYWDTRCTRTIYDLTGVKPDRAEGVHHNALDDAKAQARAVIVAYAKLGLAKVAA
ncbi:MAG: 3'-5' exoribonuclease [Proteobacteria bacterium]|nr:3'-5' exoribonuclease [Pseudomonadota bacterium]